MRKFTALRTHVPRLLVKEYLRAIDQIVDFSGKP